MNLAGLLPLLDRLPAFTQLLADTSAEPEPLALLAAARPYLVSALASHSDGPLLVITATGERAAQLAEALIAWLPADEEGEPSVFVCPDPDAKPYERIAWSGRTRQGRLTALAALASRSALRPIVVASARSLMQQTLPARELRMALRPITVGGIVRLEDLVRQWVETGYNATEVVEEPGVFARRGGIVDIWPPNLPHPVRIDLFGDQVDSLRIFDPDTQRTLYKTQRVEIGPGSEVLAKYGPAALERLAIHSGELMDLETISQNPESVSPLQDPNLLLAIREELRQEVDNLALGHSFRGIEWYLPYFYARPASLLDYLGPGSRLVVDDGADLTAALYQLDTETAGLRAELTRTGELPRDFASSFFAYEEVKRRLLQSRPLLLGFGDLLGKSSTANTPLARSFAPGPRYGGKIKQIVSDVEKQQNEGHMTVLSTRQAARLQENLTEADLSVHVQSELLQPPPPRSISLIQGMAPEGFVLRGLDLGEQNQSVNLYFYTDAELFGWSKPRGNRKARKEGSRVAPELFFADVKTGDFVVHMEHGIGVYEGLVQIELSGVEREYLQVTYSQGDKLYVPVHQADRLSRYVGSQEVPPVNRLGTADWQIVKERAKKAVEDIADDLLLLYAERELVPGYAFSPDGPWQEEMEDAFPYLETDDQLVVIDEVKRDMEAPHPMDRLICGDVGYGKTEVAMRAAFKSVIDGKQVAVLVPTTVLAQQHYRTFSRRLGAFPVKVEMLSRFRTPAQQERVLQGLLEGTVDIVIGTHRLLSKDLTFKDLGLLVVDEEQRFGVSHKERLKQLKTQVDVLTLSATPIPRTLHMSLSGIRDMSVINTPPQERLPVHTVLSEYDEVLARQAIRRELDRGGQVFVVHNRIRGIQALAQRIQHLAPDAVIDIGHGQMGERDLEDVMLRFADGQVDVLVCTTIIENGLDIPNANTIIINRADRFGLAQLYQLRGRVGRSAQRGHCYLLYDRSKELTFDARRRLAAVVESSEELGAGFRIAMRDLEIRGAGDLLGARQHGHIATVGFDLYTRLLAQAINQARRKKKVFDAAHQANTSDEPNSQSPILDAQPPTPDAHSSISHLPSAFDLNDPLAPPVTLDLPFVAEIPADYVLDEGLRLQLYRRIAGLTHLDEIPELRQELLDRFGSVDIKQARVPEAVENLFYQIEIKILALKADVQKIGRRRDQLAIIPASMQIYDRRNLTRQLRENLGELEDDRFVPHAAVHVGNEAIYLPIDYEERWRRDLVKALIYLAVKK